MAAWLSAHAPWGLEMDGAAIAQTHATSSKADLQHTHVPVKSRGSPEAGTEETHVRGLHSQRGGLPCTTPHPPATPASHTGHRRGPALSAHSCRRAADHPIPSLGFRSSPALHRTHGAQASPQGSPQPASTSHQKARLVLGDVEAKRHVR